MGLRGAVGVALAIGLGALLPAAAAGQTPPARRFELPPLPRSVDCYRDLPRIEPPGAPAQPAPAAPPGRSWSGPALNPIVKACMDQGDTTREFEAVALEVLRLNERERGATHDDTIAALRNLGEFYLAWASPNAERTFNRIIEIGVRRYGRHNAVSLQARGDIGRHYRSRGADREAERIFRSAFDESAAHLGRDHPVTLELAAGLAETCLKLGFSSEAESLYTETLRRVEASRQRDTAVWLRVVRGLVRLYVEQARDAEARTLLERALPRTEFNDRRQRSDSLALWTSMAAIHMRGGRWAEADAILQEVLELFDTGGGDDLSQMAIALIDSFEVLRVQGRYAEAEERITTAVDATADPETRHPLELSFLNSRAELYITQRRYAEADTILASALERSTRVRGPEHPGTLAIARNLAQLRLSRRTAGSAVEPARLLAAGVRSQRARFSQRPSARPATERGTAGNEVFQLLADALWSAAQSEASGRPELRAEAFAATQDAMAGAANSAIVQMAVRRYADRAQAGLGALVRERAGLDEQWAENMGRLSSSFASASPAVLAERARLTRERERIEARSRAIDARLRAEFPDYFSLVRPAPVPVAEAQRLLGPDEAILMIMPGVHGVHVFAVTADRIEWHRSTLLPAELDNAVRRLRWDAGAAVDMPDAQRERWVAEAAARGPAWGFDRTTAHRLYQRLIEPVAPVLAGKRQVYVAAGGDLAGLPLSVLVTEPPRGADNDPAALRGTAWLADRFALVHIPSIQSLALLRRVSTARRGSGRAFFGVGDPVLEGRARSRTRDRSRGATDAAQVFTFNRTRSGTAIANVRRLRRLERLPGTATELLAMRTAFGSDQRSLLMGQRATEPGVRAANLSNVRVIAFATHGLTATDMLEVAEPGLVLTPPASPTEGDDGYLAASEVSTLRLDADWVILSACNTAVGDGAEAQGLGGLARAFFYAGARNLLASHWPVSDDVAPILTVRTIELEREGLTRAEALQRAMREVRMDASRDTPTTSWAHPFYWAPFVLIGGGGR